MILVNSFVNTDTAIISKSYDTYTALDWRINALLAVDFAFVVNAFKAKNRV